MFRKLIKQMCQEYNIRPREAGEILRRRLEEAGVDPMRTYLKEKILSWHFIPNYVHRLACQTGDIKVLKLYSKTKRDEAKERKKHKFTYFKTFDDFVEWVCKTWNIQFSKANKLLRKKLKEFDVNPLAIVCYINWIGNNNLSQWQIARELGIEVESVRIYLFELRENWPSLFILGPKPQNGYLPFLFTTQKGKYLSCENMFDVIRKF